MYLNTLLQPAVPQQPPRSRCQQPVAMLVKEGPVPGLSPPPGTAMVEPAVPQYPRGVLPPPPAPAGQLPYVDPGLPPPVPGLSRVEQLSHLSQGSG